MSSTSVAGGIAPAPLQPIWPEAQSAVAQENFPAASVEQPVRAKSLPDHPTGASTDCEAPVASSKPVVESCGFPAPVRVPGQTVNGQLFTTVNVADSAPVK